MTDGSWLLAPTAEVAPAAGITPPGSGRSTRLGIAFLGVSAVLISLAACGLHSRWAALPYLALLAGWSWYWWSPAERAPQPTRRRRSLLIDLSVILLVAGLFRLYRIHELPLGPYIDEIHILLRSIYIGEIDFDLLGQTPLTQEGWVLVSNLYLYFNMLILKCAGVGYLGLKLFSVIPGVAACLFFYLLSRELMGRRPAIFAALLFAGAQWPVRLSRYGWDVSFSVMTFTLSCWLIILSFRRSRHLWAWFAGAAMGLGLYGSAGARICLASLLLFLAGEALIVRDRAQLKRLAAFVGGTLAASWPLAAYYLRHPDALWVRELELSITRSERPLATLLENLWRHALMFHVRGGVYARDNYPGLPMMGAVAGILLVLGLVQLGRHRRTALARFLGWTFFISLAGGVFSFSQEGAPYVYRAAGVMLPAFLSAGLGLAWLAGRLARRMPERVAGGVVPALLAVISLALNAYLYFALEARNTGAARVMQYELRLIAAEVHRTPLPVYLVGREIFERTLPLELPGERYAGVNQPLPLGTVLSTLGVISLSGRFDETRTLSDNLVQPRGLQPMLRTAFDERVATLYTPSVVISSARDATVWARLRGHFPQAELAYVNDLRGQPVLGVARVGSPRDGH